MPKQLFMHRKVENAYVQNVPLTPVDFRAEKINLRPREIEFALGKVCQQWRFSGGSHRISEKPL